jgi:CheY-like chemotaxis protein
MPQDLSDWRVIVVDDEPDNLGVLELVLNFSKAEVRTADSAAACLAALQDFTPTLMLIDIQMPEMSGYELLEKIRANPRWNGIPAIAVTAHAMLGDAEKVMAGGFDGYIPKPITAVTLVDEIVNIVKKQGKS